VFAFPGHMRHRHLGQVSLPIEVFVSSPEPALLRLPLTQTERMESQQNQQSQQNTRRKSQTEDFLGLISVGTHVVKMQDRHSAEVDQNIERQEHENSDDQDLKADHSHLPPAVPFSASSAISTLGNKLKKKKTSTAGPVRPSTLTDKPVRVSMHRLASATKLTDDECSSDMKDRLTLTYETETASPSCIWYPYLVLPNRGERTGEQSGGDKVESEAGTGGGNTSFSSSSNGTCLECLVDTEDLILGVRDLVDGKPAARPRGADEYIRLPWSRVQCVTAVSASCIFVTISGINLSDRIASHQCKLRSPGRRETSLDGMMNRGVKFAKRKTPPPTTSDYDEVGKRIPMSKQSSLHTLMGGFMNHNKRSFGDDNSKNDEEIVDEVDILIGPCQADVLSSVINNRLKYKTIREGIKNLMHFSQEYSASSGNENEICLIFVKASHLLEQCFRELEQLLLYDKSAFSPNNEAAESEYPQPRPMSMRMATSSSNSTNSNLAISTTKSPKFSQTKASVFYLRMYIHSLLALTVPLYEKYISIKGNTDVARESIERACSLASDSRANSNFGGVSGVHGSTFTENSERWLETMHHWSGIGNDTDSSHSDSDIESEDGMAIDIHHVIDMLEDIKMSCLNSVRLMILMGVKLDDGESTAGVLRIIDDHYTLISQLLGYFLAEEGALQRLQGQDNKTKFIKYLIISDSTLASELRTILAINGYQCSPEPVLLGSIGIKEAMRLYNRCLVGETRKWLYETIKQSKKYRETADESRLPWDIEIVGGKIISSLPETFRYQMNAYADLLKSKDESSFPYSRTLSHSEIEHLLQSAGLHEEVLRALCKSLLLLAVEFTLILKSKHWDVTFVDEKGQSVDDEQNDNLMFLASLSNDSFRMQSVHVTELLRIESNAEWSDDTNDLIGSIGSAFEDVCSSVTIQLCRVIFSDLRVVLTDFTLLWFAYSDNKVPPKSPKVSSKKKLPSDDIIDPVSSLVVTVKDFMRDLSRRQEEVLFYDTFVCCIDIVTVRYLVFLFEVIYDNSKSFNTEHLLRIEKDVIGLMTTFGVHNFESNRGVALRLATVSDVATIITATDTGESKFEGIMG
jgi:hypothetical protein